VEAYFPDVVIDGRVYLDDMMKDDENIKITTTNLTIHMRSRPFDQGAIRFASYARTEASTNKLVVKTFKDGGKKKLAHLVEDMRCQALCKAFAFEFNALLKLEYSLDFVIAACLKPKGPGGSGKLMSLEPFIKGNYIKYSSNFGWVADLPGDKINMAAQAFSHFSFERSRGNFLVSDLQGVGRVLTDASIQTRDPRQFGLSETNAGESGIMAFFATHKCNSICRKLGLRSDKSMFPSWRFTFREGWAVTGGRGNMLVCCSNKLCSQIVQASTARKSDEFPGYYWCRKCWSQLLGSSETITCVATGPPHVFSVSKFFYESQGQSIPRKCPEHRTTL
jgi:hypothetical protein